MPKSNFFNIELKGLTKTILALNPVEGLFDSDSLLDQIGSVLKFNLLTRTSEGKDFEGETFLPYSESYAKLRERKGLPSKTVDLFFTGSMLSSLTYEISVANSEVKLFFLPTKDKKGTSNPEKAFYNDQRRPFFSLSKDDVEEVEKLVNDYIMKEVF